ncbi:MAG: replicative DNA helicase [Limnochordia bacterium]|jgi:replicative DNA helicase|nr:replicative DNA helicase [Limnochordia bacterium]MDD2628634.1 replicative DNA helicase [Limnochordia bacterium]MDD4516949.1 replicative DNA helicase [Limnochordia bacterium]
MSNAPGKETLFVPYDLEAEQRVLGILIRHPERVDHCIDRLREEHFYDIRHRKIYRAIYDLYNASGQISYTQVYNRLRKNETLEDIDKVLLQLTESFVSKAELIPSIESIIDKAARRRILSAVAKIEEMVRLDTEESLSACQARAQEIIFQACQNEGEEDDTKDLLDVLTKCYRNLIERREGKVSYGLPVRYPSIDALTTGFKRKDLIILAARPSMGKTALALNFAMNVAKRDVPVLIFSLEMDDEQIGDRIVISELFRYRGQGREVTSFDYATRLDDEKLAVTEEVFNELYDLPIKIVDTRGLSVAEIRAKARKVKAEQKDLGLVIIDYLQLIRPTGDASKNWALQVGDIVRELRDLAGELDLPIILLSQLNRGVESRDNKRPRMSDLRDSGNIEEFADVIMFLYRDDYYYPEKAAADGTVGQVEVIFAKQRKGQTGKAVLRWVPEYTRFIDETYREEADLGA